MDVEEPFENKKGLYSGKNVTNEMKLFNMMEKKQIGKQSRN